MQSACNNGIRVIVAGLDMDLKVIHSTNAQLCAIADEVSKVHAICVKMWTKLASFSHRTVKNEKQVLLGETSEYEPLCRECYLRARKEDEKQI